MATLTAAWLILRLGKKRPNEGRLRVNFKVPVILEEEYTEEDGKMALNIRVERDENGEQRITKDTEGVALTTDRIRQIQEMS